MGLDMYLYGRLIGEAKGMGDELGYWRKHPNLHGFIVQTFAHGVDECQEIPLSMEDMALILAATTKDDLPVTTGFFFGQSRPEDRDHTLTVINAAISWLSEDPAREVYYQASW